MKNSDKSNGFCVLLHNNKGLLTLSDQSFRYLTPKFNIAKINYDETILNFDELFDERKKTPKLLILFVKNITIKELKGLSMRGDNINIIIISEDSFTNIEGNNFFDYVDCFLQTNKETTQYLFNYCMQKSIDIQKSIDMEKNKNSTGAVRLIISGDDNKETKLNFVLNYLMVNKSTILLVKNFDDINIDTKEKRNYHYNKMLLELIPQIENLENDIVLVFENPNNVQLEVFKHISDNYSYLRIIIICDESNEIKKINNKIKFVDLDYSFIKESETHLDMIFGFGEKNVGVTKKAKKKKKSIRKYNRSLFSFIADIETSNEKTLYGFIRKSDNSIFSIGSETSHGEILNIKENKDGEIIAKIKNKLGNIEKLILADKSIQLIKKVQIKSSDDFDMYDGETCYVVETSFTQPPYERKINLFTSTNQGNSLYFRDEINAIAMFNLKRKLFSMFELMQICDEKTLPLNIKNEIVKNYNEKCKN